MLRRHTCSSLKKVWHVPNKKRKKYEPRAAVIFSGIPFKVWKRSPNNVIVIFMVSVSVQITSWKKKKKNNIITLSLSNKRH